MSTILLSFTADVFERLERGEKKFEYRKHFPEGKTTVYFYVSNPVKAITGIGEFGNREELVTWLDKYSDRPDDVQNRIKEYLEVCNYVAPLLSFRKTSRLCLHDIQKDIPGFVVPRMYYYLDNLKLLNYINAKLEYIDAPIYHSFDNIEDDDIC